VAQAPYATPRPIPSIRPPVQLSANSVPIEQYDLAESLASQDGISLAGASDDVMNKYFEQAGKLMDQVQQGSGLRGGVLRAADSLDRLLKGR
jgi:hypothetical protein